ncbi:T6SS phospholipase effector Tle1-like catalytic domain-containing protein [Aspergillus brunneoviolaceus CBS 621.78]|uniref:Uncharacterized protein n=1 Tax=Aspergillus brunneoviolaceus CBS 621.78 TaxID=1450534 RepID=A0ACD1GMM0_9EURO|nr:hypothetical protein BO95DRAFT_497865 [Aspergillus brunneoviolaceus CBS 621.78]RAH50518.1 hypothetical protein BO95DRAFT_497865 [Aspergillus brunneoviolaceus CBS 621.78]
MNPMAQGSSEDGPSRPMRRLVICCDGSWQTSSHGLRNVASNVAKLSRSIAGWTDEDGECIQQLIYYDAGVGTANSASVESGSFPTRFVAKVQKCWEGGLGRGLEENVCEAYNFLVNNYAPGDEIYIFGFSRGAYTARALAGLICNMGICLPDMMNDWWSMYADYKLNFKRQAAEKKAKEEESGMHYMKSWGKTKPYTDWKERFHKAVEIEVVGVFDTVGALGIPTNVWWDFSERNEANYGFHDTKLHNQIKHAFHALALDEDRAPFTPTLWSRPSGVTTKLVQCWFPGYHINVGGGSDNTVKSYGDLEAMANLALVWMIDQVRHRTSLAFEDHALARFYHHYNCTIVDLSRRGFQQGSKHHYTHAETAHWYSWDNPHATHITGYGGWGLGYRPDGWGRETALAGDIPRIPGQYAKANAEGATDEFIHPIVRYATSEAHRQVHPRGSPLYYEPQALKDFVPVKNPPPPADNPWLKYEGWYWKKVDKETGETTLIPEMALWEDVGREDMLFNERDYMRADWLATSAPLKGFEESFIKEYLALANPTTADPLTRREQKLMAELEEVAAREHASTMKDGSLVYELRKCAFPGDAAKRMQLLQAAGDRTKTFLTDVESQPYRPPWKPAKLRKMELVELVRDDIE